MIPLYKPTLSGKEIDSLLESKTLFADMQAKVYSKRCEGYFRAIFPEAMIRMSSSCTQALEATALLSGLGAGDEVILPSYNYVASANAFALRGCQLVFSDIRPDTMNLDESRLEAAITDRSKAVVVMHYAGVACEMDAIKRICEKHGLLMIEDMAHAIGCSYKDQALGGFGDAACYSFDTQKNLCAFEGGAWILNRKEWFDKAAVLCESGTNRQAFERGEVPAFEWTDIGMKVRASEYAMAALITQLVMESEITENRLRLWHLLFDGLKGSEHFELPNIPDHCTHNGHIFYIKMNEPNRRKALQEFMWQRDIGTAFHYQALHKSPYGKAVGRFHGEDLHTTREADRLLRLPIFHSMTNQEVVQVIEGINDFFE